MARQAQLFDVRRWASRKVRGRPLIVCWSSGCDGETPAAGDAPWSTDLSHGPSTPNQEHGAPTWWETALAVKSSSVSDVRYERAVLWDDSLSATAQGLTRRTASTLAKSVSRPLRGTRVNGNVLFSTTHFS